MAKEQVKRLTPTPDALRELFAKSGNICAFPGCRHLIIDADGTFIAQTCHIAAAEEGGERFDENMTNESRRHVSNLMLMCYKHHTKTNNVDEFSVARLKQIKADHEAKFTDVENRIIAAFKDELGSTVVRGGIDLGRLRDVLKWEHDDDLQKDFLEDFKIFSVNLMRVPRETRELLLVLVERGMRPKYIGGGRAYLEVPHREIASAVRQSDSMIKEHVEILEKYDIAEGVQEPGSSALIKVYDTKSDWPIWSDLKTFSDMTGTPLHELIVGLNFSSLDYKLTP